MLTVAAALVVGFWYWSERQEDRVVEWLEGVALKGPGSVADFRVVDWIEWDSVCLIGPYLPGDRVSEVIGARWRWGTSSFNENRQLVVFTRRSPGGQNRISRSVRYISSTHFHVDSRCYERDKARFVVEGDSRSADFKWADP